MNGVVRSENEDDDTYEPDDEFDPPQNVSQRIKTFQMGLHTK